MRDLAISWAGVFFGAFLHDVNIVLASISYLTASVYTGVKIYKHFNDGKQ